MSAVSFDSEKLADVLASPNTEPIKKDVEVEIVSAPTPAPTAAKISQSPSQTITCMPDGNAAWPGFVFAVALSGQGVFG